MYATMNSKHHFNATSAMSAEAAASACALFVLGSAMLAESIFVVLISIIIVLSVLVRPGNTQP